MVRQPFRMGLAGRKRPGRAPVISPHLRMISPAEDGHGAAEALSAHKDAGTHREMGIALGYGPGPSRIDKNHIGVGTGPQRSFLRVKSEGFRRILAHDPDEIRDGDAPPC